MGKHWDSLESWVKEYTQADINTERWLSATRGEGILSRLDDLRNYLDLVECYLYQEGVHAEQDKLWNSIRIKSSLVARNG